MKKKIGLVVAIIFIGALAFGISTEFKTLNNIKKLIQTSKLL